MRVLGIIPARYGSSRLEGKPLAEIAGKPMVQHVYERASQALDDLYVATDDERIVEAINRFGGKVMLTSKEHLNGTSRCKEVAVALQEETTTPYTHVINIQGDELLLDPNQLQLLQKIFLQHEDATIATIVSPVTSQEELLDSSECFVVLDKQGRALYFSRSIIPHIFGEDKTVWLDKHNFLKHVGFYAYTYEALCRFVAMPPSSLETLESLEQNRWLEAGEKIYATYSEYKGYAVDTQENLDYARFLLNEKLGKK